MLYAIVAVIALIIDQAVKYWTTAHIVLNEGRHNLIPGFIHLTNVHNTGAAFSLIEGARWLFVVLCALFVAALIYLLVKNIIKGRAARWFAVLVMAGAIGNCIDRIISGYVVDMLEFDFKIFGQQFPVFNVADILITVCGIAFCVCILMEKPEDERAKQARQAAAAGRTDIIRPRRPAVQEGNVTPFPGSRAVGADDPFAEWERMSAPKRQGTSGAAGRAPAPAPGSAAQHGAKPALDEPMSHVRPAPTNPPAPGPQPPAPEVQQPAQPPRPASGPDETSFDLDDILAEFRDL